VKDRAEALGEADGDALGLTLGVFDGLALGLPVPYVSEFNTARNNERHEKMRG